MSVHRVQTTSATPPEGFAPLPGRTQLRPTPLMPAAASVASAYSAAAALPELHIGARGPAVSDLQSKLKAAGFDPGPVDGSFGPRTEAAVRRFQASRGITVDGWVGPQTWGQLLGTGPVTPPNGSSSVDGPISRSEVLSRAMSWVNRGVPYSMNKSATDPGGRLYRTDCSGLVSMANHLGSSPSTVNMTDYVHPIEWSDLKPGDIVGTLGPGTGGANGHVVIFNGWTLHGGYAQGAAVSVQQHLRLAFGCERRF
jgi:cell wall-associated NlpC family hydrolase